MSATARPAEEGADVPEVMAEGQHSCHDMAVPSQASDVLIQGAHERAPAAGTPMVTAGASHGPKACCAGGCCASPGIPFAPAMADVATLTWGPAIGSPSVLLTGESAEVFRPPIG